MSIYISWARKCWLLNVFFIQSSHSLDEVYLYLDTGEELEAGEDGQESYSQCLGEKKEKSEPSVVKLKLFFGQRGDKFGELKYYL